MRTSISNTQAREAIIARANGDGFDAIGFAPARAPEGAGEALREFLAKGFHGTMGWMEATQDRRADPQKLWPEAKTAILFGINYGPEADPLKILERRQAGAISVYAQNEDYHEAIKKKLKRIAHWMADEYGAKVKVFVDTAPVMEKPFGQASGIGWQGKHTNLVSREFGSWLFLGSIFTTLALAASQAEEDHCGTCRACLDICPTQAFPAPYRIDARRCISYLTIEHKGHIGREFREAMGNRIYGCDDCLAVCPWNKFAVRAREEAFHPREELKAPLLADLVALDDGAFRALFRKSPVKRIGRDRFLRNVLIAIGNSGEAGLVPSVKARLHDASPLVRAMAVWALSKLLGGEEFAALRQEFVGHESDAGAAGEWDRKSTGA
jgi:epoxyqueuosine reductase